MLSENLGGLINRFTIELPLDGEVNPLTRPDIAEILNLQPRGSCAKPYQVKQVRAVIIRYKLGGEDE
jgi:hypothetical protein